MCVNAQKTIINLMAEIEPSIVALGNEAGISTNPLFETAVAEYNVALKAVEAWTSGTAAQEVIEVVNDLEAGIDVLPIPAAVQTLANIILAGIATVVAVLSANSPAPVAAIPTTDAEPLPDATPEEAQGLHQAAVAADAQARIGELVPGFKRSIWHSAGAQYKSEWNKECDRLWRTGAKIG